MLVVSKKSKRSTTLPKFPFRTFQCIATRNPGVSTLAKAWDSTGAQANRFAQRLSPKNAALPTQITAADKASV